MNQDVHVLLTILGKQVLSNDKKEVMDFSKKYMGVVGILDSFRCRMPRQVTHFTSGSYWKLPESLEELKKSKPEDMNYFISKYSQNRIEKRACVDETIILENLVKNNLSLFTDGSDENYGTLVLAHALQDFYSDIVWRMIYNFNNQTEIILKTEEKIPTVNEFLSDDESKPDKSPKYHKLSGTVQESDKKFRVDYRVINCYVSYLLSKELEKLGYRVWVDEDDNIFKDILGSFEELYPEDVFSSCKKYITYLPETRESIETQDPTQLKTAVEEIFGENKELFLKMMENMLLSYREASLLYKQIQHELELNGGQISQQSLSTIFGKYNQIASDIHQYEESAYNRFFGYQEQGAPRSLDD